MVQGQVEHLGLNGLAVGGFEYSDWTPEVDVEEGLRRSVEWYMENRETMSRIDLGM